MAGTLDVKNLTSIEAALMAPRYIPQTNCTVIQQELINLSAFPGDPAFTALINAMDNIPSHANLAGLLFPNHYIYDQQGTLSIAFRTEQDVTTILLLYNDNHFYWENRYGCLSATERVYSMEADTFDILADLMKEYGTNSGAA